MRGLFPPILIGIFFKVYPLRLKNHTMTVEYKVDNEQTNLYRISFPKTDHADACMPPPTHSQGHTTTMKNCTRMTGGHRHIKPTSRMWLSLLGWWYLVAACTVRSTDAFALRSTGQRPHGGHVIRSALARNDDYDSTSAAANAKNNNKNNKNGGGLPGSEKPERSDRNLGGYDPSERIGSGINVGDPQIKLQEKERSVTSILKELAAIQQQGPQKYCILGTRHCSFLHQQIIELLYVMS